MVSDWGAVFYQVIYGAQDSFQTVLTAVECMSAVMIPWKCPGEYSPHQGH